MAEGRPPGGWWQTVPGILTASAATISAIAGLIMALHQAGMFDRENQPGTVAVGIGEPATSETAASSPASPAPVAASPPTTGSDPTERIATAPATSALTGSRPETPGTHDARAELLARARSVLREEGPSPAAQMFADALRRDPSHTIVVRDNCDSFTLRQAIFIVPTTELIVLPLPGSGCFRVGWGLFTSEAEAREILPRVLGRMRQAELAVDGRVELVAAVLQ